MNKWNCTKLKNFCTPSAEHNRVGWEGILQTMYLMMGQYAKYKTNSCRSIAVVINNASKKWTEEPNRYLCKEDIRMAKRHVKGCSVSLIIREMQTEPE